MNKKESAGGVITNNKGQVVVVNQNYNSWSLPKGHVDPGESHLDAAKREILEETGLTELELIGKLGSYERFRISLKNEDNPELKNLTFFHFTTTQLELKPIDETNPEAKWVDKKEVANYLTHTKDKEFFLSIIDKI